MEAIKTLLAAQTALEKATSDFLHACATLTLVAIPSLTSTPGRLAFENNVESILSSVDTASLVEDRVCESRFILKKLLNMSTTRVPAHKLPVETLSYIFSIVVASSPCHPTDKQRDTLLDIPQVCMSWNRVAVDTPSLWSHIDLDLSRFSVATALERARIWLKRCNYMPIHLHLNGSSGGVSQNDLSDILAVLEPHAGSLCSLVFTSYCHDSLVRALLGFVSGPLRILVISAVTATFSQRDLSSRAIDSSQIHSDIPLPLLRFLEISSVRRNKAIELLSKLVPGVLELDVRLDAEYFKDDRFNSPSHLFLARSNVVSLAIYRSFLYDYADQSLTYLASVPHLRVLQLGSINLVPSFARALGVTLNGEPYLKLPCLRSLCFVQWCAIGSWAIDAVEQIAGRIKLQSLAFRSCRFLPTFTPPINRNQESQLLCSDNGGGGDEDGTEGEGEDEDDGNDDDEDHDKYQDEMPQSMKDYFSEQIAKVTVCNKSIEGGTIYHGVDPFVQSLTRPD
ncbi:hypothetical protein FRC12_001975 [Ceratobasidium sp. 428]|nr:hypothetical protein FRC12_001975 [Ceratobasidium sp. 428]